ncbi:hypothetical protein NK718_05815 [Alsobacter sp. SYSU M60028]|uniref:Thioredoxin n=1 Tax=Alsobacter ponti TaxID=2962936 RepID=A0ABT1L964_9HYPH|nr:hypothetical protein [Alsobacter ponti]MCP8938026.1 hypothetical protein [Alsobacter ponti]
MHLHRRRLLLSGAALAAALGLPGGEARAAASAKGLTVVYISARNCPICREWNATKRDAFAARCAARGVPFRVVEVASFGDIRVAAEWPDDLRPLLAQFSDKGGTPRFLLVDNGKVVGNVLGALTWREDRAAPGN